MSFGISSLASKSLVLIFAYAPAGLGHLRVTDALYHGLPKGAAPLLLGSQDKSITYLHRITSVHPLAKKIMEATQSGIGESIFTSFYRFFLKSRSELIYKQMVTVLDQRLDLPETVLIVATHFGLAHQLAAIKTRLEEERRVRIILIVQVTDDSPQKLWYVGGADMIFVPSEKTKKELLRYGKAAGLPETKIEIVPYPVSPILGERFTAEEFRSKQKQVNIELNTKINIVVPVSGAAVGLTFVTKLIDELYKKSKRFSFHVISKASLYTQFFLAEMLARPHVELHISTHDRGVLDKYEEVYNNEAISLEVTKPSEQTFKALLSPYRKGGSILLFSEPVGRQEFDNLDFLERHYLIPHEKHQQLLWEMAVNGGKYKEIHNEEFDRISSWRGLRLPKKPEEAANFIWWCMKEGIYEKMLRWEKDREIDKMHKEELGTNGVSQFWSKVVEYLNEP